MSGHTHSHPTECSTWTTICGSSGSQCRASQVDHDCSLHRLDAPTFSECRRQSHSRDLPAVSNSLSSAPSENSLSRNTFKQKRKTHIFGQRRTSSGTLASPAIRHWGTCPIDFQQFIFFSSLCCCTKLTAPLCGCLCKHKNYYSILYSATEAAVVQSAPI